MSSAEIYAKYGIENYEYIDEIFDRLLKLLTWHENESILDIGSGTGEVLLDTLLPKLPNDIAKVVASDISEEMLDYCSKKISTKGVFSCIKLDIESKFIPSELENQFDHLFSTYCLMFVNDLRQALTNCFHLLKPGGELFFIFSTSDILSEIHKRMCNKNAKWIPFLGHRKDYKPPFHNISNTAATISEYFEESGFQVKFCEIDSDLELNYPSIDILFKIAESLDCEKFKIPNADIGSYQQDFLKSLLSFEELRVQTIGKKRMAFLRYPTVAIIAKKKDPDI